MFVNRLVVVSRDGPVAYDEQFHHGLNMIRGENGSGKSTIANFLFFGLGGDFNKWTAAAKSCGEVLIEVEASGATLTLKRGISDSSQQGMSIFWGPYEEARKSGKGWSHFQYKQTDAKESFSTAIFRALEFPEVKSSEDQKITMHQILRLLYIDQESPSENLFRFERFDQPLTRQAIAELLLGVYDDALHTDRLALRDAKQKFHQKDQEFKAVSRIFGSAGTEIDIGKIQKEIEKTQKQLDKEQDEIQKIRTRELKPRQAKSPRVEKLQDELSSLKGAIAKITSEVRNYEFDIIDSKDFVETLEKRLIAIKDAIATRRVLGELPLQFCPICMRPLGDSISADHCVLCKQPVQVDLDRTFGKRLRQEIEIQIKESSKLLQQKNKKLSELNADLNSLVGRLHLAQREIDLEENEYRSTRDERLDVLLVSKGRLEKQIDTLNEQISAAGRLEDLRRELQELAREMQALEQRVRIREEKEGLNYRNAKAKIEAIALRILQLDLGYQSEFSNPNHAEIDFMKDSYSLDGQNNFSASSNVYLKNSIRFAIFFASLELAYFRYPRFILCDNTEDKGMQPERSHNFQGIIAKMSESHQVDHQIILTTSMINPSFDNSAYCIGDFYTKTNRSLKIT
jgi:hypothetical protein